MSRILCNSLMLATLATLLAGCGVSQSLSDASASTARAIFYKQVNTLHLDFSARTAINTDMNDMNAMSVSTLVRVYQLSDTRAMDEATYDSLLGDDDSLLGSALLDKRTLVVKPGEGAQLDVPLAKDARFVSVVALFRHPEMKNAWRLTLTREELNPDRARVIELGENRLTLRPVAKE